MKKKLILFIIFCFLSVMYAADTSTTKTTVTKKTDVKPTTSTKQPSTTSQPTTKQPSTTKQPLHPKPMTATPVSKKVEKDVIGYEYYSCPKCKKDDFVKPGKCPKCKVDLVKKIKSFTYVCPKCGYSQDKEGKCPNCKDVTLKKYEVLYQCISCNFTSGEPGKCPKCLQDLKKIKIPVKK
jgi:ribosomal protein L37AE/L43A